MGQSIKSRLNGNSSEAVQYARDFGVGAFMDKYEVKDYVAATNFLRDQAPGENFTYSRMEAGGMAGLADSKTMLRSMLAIFHDQETKIDAQAKEIMDLRRQLNVKKANDWRSIEPEVQAILSKARELKQA